MSWQGAESRHRDDVPSVDGMACDNVAAAWLTMLIWIDLTAAYWALPMLLRLRLMSVAVIGMVDSASALQSEPSLAHSSE